MYAHKSISNASDGITTTSFPIVFWVIFKRRKNCILEAGLPNFSRYKIPKRGKIYQMITKCTKLPQKIPNGRKIDQTAKKYTNIFNCKTLHNLPKLGFLVWKYTIWQPWQEVIVVLQVQFLASRLNWGLLVFWTWHLLTAF
jgi:hypothetical protein